MRSLGNIIWFFIIGLWSAIAYFVLGILWSITIIGLPIGIQCFKFAHLVILPFRKDVEFTDSLGKTLINIIWLFLGGIELAVLFIFAGFLFCITIIGIPFGMQCFKLAKLSLMPLGAEIVDIA